MENLILKKIDTKIFKHIYEDMLLQFPSSELKSYDEFINLFKHKVLECHAVFDGEKEVGYIIYALLEDKSLWLDYIAIKKEFHSNGYGRKVFELINNCYLEVEKPDETKPDTLRRIKFYKSLGAQKLNVDYTYPNLEGGMQMDLYYLGDKIPSRDTINSDIKYIFNTLHADIPNVDKILNKIIA